MNRGDPTIAAPFYGFYEDRIVGGIPQRVPKTVDGAADAVIEVDEYPLRPESVAKLVAAEDLVRMVEQELQGAKGQILNLDSDAVPAEFAGMHVGLERSKPNDRGGLL